MKRVKRLLIANAAMLLGVLALSARPAMAADENDALAKARQLAYSGKEHRDEALSILKAYLEKDDDSDARTLYGTVLSWQGRYDEARVQLGQVLAKNPTHGDALPAALNVEFWSGHPENADVLARRALEKDPNNTEWMLAEARALRKMNQEKQANQVLDRILVLDGGNKDAQQMRRESSVTTTKPTVSISHTYDWFSDGRSGQHESTIQWSNPTPFGSVIARANRADRFGLTSYQTELDFYPRIHPGLYGLINVGYSWDANLYPRYRVGGDLFQSVGKGYEVSGGYRRLSFGNGVNIYTFAVSKYYRNFLFTGRGYVVPGDPGTSGTAQFSARYFLGSEGLHDYIEFRYSHGASPAQALTTQDIQVLSANKWTVVMDKVFFRHLAVNLSGGVGISQQIGLSDLSQYTGSATLYYRF